MIRLQPDTPSQQFLVTPYESRKFLPSFAQYLFVFESQFSKQTFKMIGLSIEDNERYSRFEIDTSNDDPLNGDVIILESGLYQYAIYGQNSLSNLKPESALVVGLLERGPMQIIGEDAWTIPTFGTPDNVVYYE